MRKIECITICVGYSDFLKEIIPFNKDVFTRWLIVTSSNDGATQELCLKYGLECFITDVFYNDGAKFNKYAAINEGLKQLDKDGWICFLDGDIALSPLSKRVLQEKTLDSKNIYGIDRLNCRSYERWQEYLGTEGVLHDNWLLHGAGLEFGARIVHIYGEKDDTGKYTGYKPIGYFQLVHNNNLPLYPEGSKDASHGDLAFAKLWKEEERQLIPEIIGIHLCTEEYKGQNWESRKSKLFQYSIITTKWNRFKLCFWKIFRKILNWFKSIFSCKCKY